MAGLIVINNISDQGVPILLNDIERSKGNPDSAIKPQISSQNTIPAGAELRVERQRVDLAQLERLQQLNLITFN